MPITSASLRGAGTIIAAATLGGAAASVSISSITSGYKWFKLIVQASNSAASGTAVYIRFNNDSGNNYNWYRVKGTGSAASSDNAAGTAQIVSAMADSGTPGKAATELNIIQGSCAAVVKSVIGTSGYTNTEVFTIYANWNNSADEINRIDLIASSNNITAGSYYMLIGYV